MIKIKTIADFQVCLEARQTIVFIFFDWSGQAHVSRRMVENWENRKNNLISLFELNPEESDFADDWVRHEVKDLRGYGSLVWMREGKIIDFKPDAGKLGVFGIEEICVRLFETKEAY